MFSAKRPFLWSLILYLFVMNSLFSKEIAFAHLFNQLASAEREEKQLPKQVGVILIAKGKVHIKAKDGLSRKAKSTSPLYIGDQLKTAEKSYAQLSFLDGSTLKLGKKSQFKIDDYHFDERKGEGKHNISIDEGVVGFFAGKISKIAPQNYKIKTETAVIGIRGSAGEIVVSPGSTLTRVAEGHAIAVETSAGLFVVDDPTQALSVTDTGVEYVEVGPGSWLEESPEDSEEEEDSEESQEEEEEEEKKEEEQEEDKQEEEQQEEEREEQEEQQQEEQESESEENQKRESQIEEAQEEESSPVATGESDNVESAGVDSTLQVEESVTVDQEFSIVTEIENTIEVVQTVILETIETFNSQDDDETTTSSNEDSAPVVDTEVDTTLPVIVDTSDPEPEEPVVEPTPDEYLHTVAADELITGYNYVLDTIEWQYENGATSFELTEAHYPNVKVWDPTTGGLELIDNVSFGVNPPTGEQEVAGQAALVVRAAVDWGWGIGGSGIVNFNGISIQKNLDGDRSFGISEGVLDIDNHSYHFLTFHPSEDGFSDPTNNPSLQDYLIIVSERGTVDSNASSYIQVDHYLFSLNPFADSTLYSGQEHLFDFSDNKFQQDVQLQWGGDNFPEILATYQWAIVDGQNSHALGVTRGVNTVNPLIDPGVTYNGSSVGFSFGSNNAHELENSFNSLSILSGSDYALDIPTSGTTIGDTAISDTGTVNFFISKNAFFSELDTSFTAGKSFIAAVPGLDSFENIGWGIWAKEVSASDDPSFGYLAIGLESARTQASEITALANANTYINYTGPAMGTLFTGSTVGPIQFGETIFSINFNTGSISGGINYPNYAIQFSEGTIDASAGTIMGSALFSDGTNNTGNFRMDLFGTNVSEVAGTYGVNGINDNSEERSGIGVFGVRAEP